MPKRLPATARIPDIYARDLQALHKAQSPQLGASLAAAKEAGWTLKTLAAAVGLSTERVRQIVLRADTGVSPLPPPDPHNPQAPKQPTKKEWTARALSVGWELAQDWEDGPSTTRRSIACATCGTVPRTRVSYHGLLHQQPCRRPHAAPTPRAPLADVPEQLPQPGPRDRAAEEHETWAAAWREVARQHGWEPLEDQPKTKSAPWPMRCFVCRRVSKRQAAGQINVNRLCTHPGMEAQQVSAEEREAREARRARLEQAMAERWTEEARAAGWEPQEAPPTRDSTPWRLKCAGCGYRIKKAPASQEHTRPHPHRAQPRQTLPAYYAGELLALQQAGHPQLAGTISAAHAAGWTYVALAAAMDLPVGRVREIGRAGQTPWHYISPREQARRRPVLRLPAPGADRPDPEPTEEQWAARAAEYGWRLAGEWTAGPTIAPRTAVCLSCGQEQPATYHTLLHQECGQPECAQRRAELRRAAHQRHLAAAEEDQRATERL